MYCFHITISWDHPYCDIDWGKEGFPALSVEEWKEILNSRAENKALELAAGQEVGREKGEVDGLGEPGCMKHDKCTGLRHYDSRRPASQLQGKFIQDTDEDVKM